MWVLGSELQTSLIMQQTLLSDKPFLQPLDSFFETRFEYVARFPLTYFSCLSLLNASIIGLNYHVWL